MNVLHKEKEKRPLRGRLTIDSPISDDNQSRSVLVRMRFGRDAKKISNG
jgi:hypothetical protein